MRLLHIVVIVAVGFVVSSCSSTDLPEPIAPIASPRAEVTPPIPDALPPVLGMREPCGLTEEKLTGADTHSRSGFAMDIGETLMLAAADNGLSWGMWRFNTEDELLYLQFDLSLAAGEEVWLALANGARGCWEITGPVSSNHVLILDPLANRMPDGSIYVIAIVFDGNQAQIENLTLLADHPKIAPTAVLEIGEGEESGITPHTVHFDASNSYDTDGEVEIYYWDFDGDGYTDKHSYNSATATYTYTTGGTFRAEMYVEDDMRVRDADSVLIVVKGTPVVNLLADDTKGDAPLTVAFDARDSFDWDGSIVDFEWDLDGDGAFNETGPEASARGEDRTVHTYSAPGNYPACLRLTDDEGFQGFGTTEIMVTGGWVTTTVDSTWGDKGCSSLAAVNGNPAILYFDSSPGKMKYVRAVDSIGSEWGFPVTVGNSDGSYASLVIVNGIPAILFSGTAYFNSSPKYIRANDADGCSWSEGYEIDELGGFLSLAVVDNRPAISSISGGSDRNLTYIMGNDADGSSWSTPVILDDHAHYPCLSVINSNPAIAYWYEEPYPAPEQLKYIQASDASGTNWNTPITVESGDHNSFRTALANVNGNPAIIYFDRISVPQTVMEYVRANDANGNSWGTPMTIYDDAGWWVGSASLVVVGGTPAVSLCDYTKWDLEYVRANDADGISWNVPITVDSTWDVGLYSSLAVVGGKPAISYVDYTHGDLKYAYAVD